MSKNNFKFFINNIFKGFLGLAVCNVVGYVLYLVFLNAKNADYPKNASLSTAILSVLLFGVSVYVIARFALMGTLNTESIDERGMLEKVYKESNYTLDYKAYFKDQVKTRLCGYYLAAALWQIPLIVNYALIVPSEFTIYNSPISIYKWNMMNIFGYELLGKAWFFGPVLFLALFIPIFTFIVYKEQKKWLVKPSYIK